MLLAPYLEFDHGEEEDLLESGLLCFPGALAGLSFPAVYISVFYKELLSVVSRLPQSGVCGFESSTQFWGWFRVFHPKWFCFFVQYVVSVLPHKWFHVIPCPRQLQWWWLSWGECFSVQYVSTYVLRVSSWVLGYPVRYWQTKFIISMFTWQHVFYLEKHGSVFPCYQNTGVPISGFVIPISGRSTRGVHRWQTTHTK